MATGSKATRLAERDKAGYLTGQRQSMPRCDSCCHSKKPSPTVRQTQYDLRCERHIVGVKTHGVCVFWNPEQPPAVTVPAQLQINQTGSWRSALDFDLAAAPPEFLETADQLARMAGSKTTMRVVSCRRTDSGSTMPTGNVLKRWDRESGWVDSTPPKS
jgi:hypothetical protein